jgi:hypothetical protein
LATREPRVWAADLKKNKIFFKMDENWAKKALTFYKTTNIITPVV